MNMRLTWTGRVIQIRDGIAYVDLYSNGQLSFYAEVEAEDLAKHDIGDHDKFELVATDDTLEFKKIPGKPLSAERVAEISASIDKILPDNLFDHDES